MQNHSGSRSETTHWLARVGWLVALWAGGVTGLGVAAWLLKSLMRAAGLA